MSHIFLVALLLILVACTPWRVEYLEEVEGRATQDEIAQRMGAPNGMVKLKNGGEVWTYTSCSGHVIDGNGKFSCKDYVLNFDQGGVLRSWRRQ